MKFDNYQPKRLLWPVSQIDVQRIMLGFLAFYEILFSCIIENLYHRANLPPSLRPIARFALELERFVHDRDTSIENEKLRFEGVDMYAYGVSVYYA